MFYLSRILFFIFSGVIVETAYSQDTTDAQRLASLSYMEYADKIDCENTTGTTLEERICLNLKFQKVDSILTTLFNTFTASLDDGKLKASMVEYQNGWIICRRHQSEIESDGFTGHMFGIMYLTCMVEMTERRIGEVGFMLED